MQRCGEGRNKRSRATSASMVPLEDMSDPKTQLELREVIIVSLRDSSLTIRTTTKDLLQHSKQLLNAARELEAPLPLDCSAATMGILEKLFWAEPWENAVNALTRSVSNLHRFGEVRLRCKQSRSSLRLLCLLLRIPALCNCPTLTLVLPLPCCRSC